MRSISGALVVAVVAGMCVIACDRSGTSTATTEPSTSQEVRRDLEAAGQNIKSAATEVGREIKPALENAREKAREGLHDLSQRIADRTATAPATQP